MENINLTLTKNDAWLLVSTLNDSIRNLSEQDDLFQKSTLELIQNIRTTVIIALNDAEMK